MDISKLEPNDTTKVTLLELEVMRLRESLQKIANLPYWNKPVIRGKREVGWRAHCIAVTALGGAVGKRRTVNEQKAPCPHPGDCAWQTGKSGRRCVCHPCADEQKAPDSLLYKSPPEAESLRQWVGEQTAVKPCPVCDGIGEHKWNCTLNR